MKSWRAEIEQHILNWSRKLGNLGWWPRYIYHFTDVQNAINILKDGVLFSRAEAKKLGRMMVDNASPDVIAQTRLEHTQFVRLYFRPRTPTQYRNEGIRPQKRRELGGAHCPVPIYFCFDALEILSQDTTEVSSGNMGSTRASHSNQRDFFFKIPFQYVFHNRAFSPEMRDEIVFRRNAEVLVPDKLSLEPSLKFLTCRSVAERQTFLHLLPHKIASRWQERIRLGEQGFFERKWTYVEEVVVVEWDVTFRFNPSTLTPGPFDVRMEYREHNTRSPIVWHKSFERLPDVLPLRFRSATWGEIRLYLDDALSFSDTIFFEGIPF